MTTAPGSETPPDGIALVGAYERDNFGDLLLGLVTERMLGARVSWTAPTTGSTDDLLQRPVAAYPELFEHDRPTGIWVVGGEVGGVTLRGLRRYNELDADTDLASGLASPYLPRPSSFHRTADVPYVVNSVGLSGILRLKPGAAAAARAALREADAVSVRDPRSSALLAELGIEHRVAPDVVHTLPLVHPVTIPRRDVAIVQIREKDTDRLSLAEAARVLDEATGLAGLGIRLFVAGTAPGHDSLAHYRELEAELESLAPGRDVAILGTRDPLVLATAIASSRVWVGTSLHGRIIAAAYGVPRVSLDVPKVNRYAAHWDSAMPSGVAYADLPTAVQAALIIGPDEVGAELGRLAAENLAALSRIFPDDPGRALARAARRIELRGEPKPSTPPRRPAPTGLRRLMRGAHSRLQRLLRPKT